MDPRAHNMCDWFTFLSPLGVIREYESSLYPFPPEEVESRRSWVTARHLRALNYYLSYGNKQAFLVHNEKANLEDETTFLFQVLQPTDEESSTAENEQDEAHLDENNNIIQVLYSL